MAKIKKGDEVVVITGKDRGRRGKVSAVLATGKVVVDGINTVKRHTKANPSANVEGGIITKEMPIQISNVMVVNPETNTPARAGYSIADDGTKTRVFKAKKTPATKPATEKA